MHLRPRSLRVAGVAAALSAVTTFLLWLLPNLYAPPSDFAQAVALHQNPVYLARLWVNFVHIFLAVVAYAGAAWLLWRRSPFLAGLGLVWFLLWGLTELLGVSTNIIAVNGTWRADFATATPEVQGQIQILLFGFRAVWDALFFLLLIFFLLGSLSFGLAAIRGEGFELVVSILFLLSVPLTLAIIVGGYTRFEWVASPVEYVYPLLQPVSRLVMGVWLWRSAGLSSGGPNA